jgi:hypothetical protein
LLATATSSSHYSTGVRPGLVCLGTGVGMGFVLVAAVAFWRMPSTRTEAGGGVHMHH